MEVFSYSRLSKYEDCPAAFYRHYVLDASEIPTELLAVGKASHSVIEAAMKLDLKDEASFRVLSKIAADNAPVPISPEEIFEMTYREIVLKEFHPENKIEEHFVVPLSDDPFTPSIQGYIDLYRDSGFVQIVDWKTNRKPYYPTDTKQLGLYAWHKARETGKAVRGKLVFLRLNESPEHEFSYRDMEDAREWALNLALEIQGKLCQIKEGADYAALFPIRPGDACRYCGFSMECVMESGLSVPGEIKTYPEAESLGAEILRLESALGNMKDMLKSYVEAAGPVTVGGRQFLIKESRYWK
ncbi:MAG: PD-(D/E)XK nuclease family protein, partial [Firmicutes bacterium]|nr:PD-(D/E)XK nuclease family protein [Bacillota bacterium]